MRALFVTWSQKSTYLRLFYLLLALPLATVYFAGVVAGVSVGIGLAIVLVGVPILLAVVVGWRGVARFERFLGIALLDAAIEPTPPALPEGDGVWGRARALTQEPFT